MKKISLFFYGVVFLAVLSGLFNTRTAIGHASMKGVPQSPVARQLLPVSSQPNLRFDCLAAADGLSFSLATSIVQDQQGFMWFGTLLGINKYDGYSFTPSLVESGKDPLNELKVSGLYRDHAGDLWIITQTDLVRQDHLTGEYIRYPRNVINPHDQGSGIVTTVGEDAVGNLWVGTNYGLYRFDDAMETFSYVFPSLAILSFYADDEGGIWLGTFGGLYHYSSSDFVSNTLVKYRHSPDDPASISSDWVSVIYEDQQGVIWVGTLDRGLNRLDRRTGKFTRYQPIPGDPLSLSDRRINSILEDASGRLWIGTHNGLNLLDRSSGSFFGYYHDPGNPQSLISNRVLHIYQDRSNILWVATFAGICKLNDLASLFTYYGQAPEPPEHKTGASSWNLPGLSDKQVSAIYQDHQGILWIGTYSGNLNRLDRSTGNVTVYKHDPIGTSDVQVDVILEDQAGSLWIGTNFGLDRFDPQTGGFITEGGFRNQSILSMIEDQQGNLWVATPTLIGRRASGKSTFTGIPLPGGLPKDSWMLKIFLDRFGSIWISTSKDGLFRLDKPGQADASIIHYPQDSDLHSLPWIGPIVAFYEDENGSLWMGSLGDGLIRYRYDTQTFTRYLPDIAPPNFVGCIMGDAQGFLWLGTRLGLARFHPSTETFQYYDKRDGLEIGETLSCYKNKQGEMFFGSWAGLITFFPEKIVDNLTPPTVAITSLNVNNRALRTDLSPDEYITLSYQENYLSFDFAALDYTAPAKNQYAYRMEGLETDWVEAGVRRHAEYPDLKPGTYTFRVKASNSSGVWNEQGVAVHIMITPPFWQSWWFLSLVGLALLVSGYSAYRIRIQRMEAQHQELENQVKERTDEINQRRKELEALYQADENLYRHLDLEQVLLALIDTALHLLNADKGSVLCWDAQKENLVIRAARNFQSQTIANTRIPRGKGKAGKVAQSGVTAIVEDSTQDASVTQAIVQAENIRAFIQVPIKVENEVFGVFSADYTSPRSFEEDEIRLLLALAQRAGIAIQNARLYEQSHQLAALEERSRLARELHDAVTQTLFSASLVAEALPAAWEKDPQEGRGLLQELRGLSRGALAEMRTLLLELRPAALLDTRLDDLLRQLGEAASGRAGIPVPVQIEGETELHQAALPPDVHIALYRITQEALNNVVKHARAHQAMVRLSYRPENQTEPLHILLSISDDGRGFDPAQLPHNRLGLGIMQERAQAIGGALTLESQPGQGTRVTVLWQQAKNQEAT